MSLALLYLALRGINFAAIQSRLSQINLGWIALAVLVTMVQIFLGALRWREISALCQAPLTDLQAFRYNMIGAFFNQTLPSSIGGDAVRLWLVKRTGAGWRAATYSILTDRAVGLIALALIIVASLPWSYGMIADSNGRLALVVVDFAALAGGLGFLLLGRSAVDMAEDLVADQACPCLLRHRQPGDLQPPQRSEDRGPVALDSRAGRRDRLVRRSLDRGAADFEQVFMLIPPIMLITMMPISIAGWGVREATMMVAFGYAGLVPDGRNDGLDPVRAVYFIVGALGGLVWILSAEKQRSACRSPVMQNVA